MLARKNNLYMTFKLKLQRKFFSRDKVLFQEPGCLRTIATIYSPNLWIHMSELFSSKSDSIREIL